MNGDEDSAKRPGPKQNTVCVANATLEAHRTAR
jgi:hypothetical protein